MKISQHIQHNRSKNKKKKLHKHLKFNALYRTLTPFVSFICSKSGLYHGIYSATV